MQGFRKGKGTGHMPPFLNQDEKHLLLFFCLFNKSILKQQHAENTAKCAKIDVSELLKLQNVLRALNTVAVRKLVDLVYLFYLFIWHFIFRWCLQVANANKNQQNTIKILLISSTQNKRTVNISQFFKCPFQVKDEFTMFNRPSHNKHVLKWQKLDIASGSFSNGQFLILYVAFLNVK